VCFCPRVGSDLVRALRRCPRRKRRKGPAPQHKGPDPQGTPTQVVGLGAGVELIIVVARGRAVELTDLVAPHLEGAGCAEQGWWGGGVVRTGAGGGTAPQSPTRSARFAVAARPGRRGVPYRQALRPPTVQTGGTLMRGRNRFSGRGWSKRERLTGSGLMSVMFRVTEGGRGGGGGGGGEGRAGARTAVACVLLLLLLLLLLLPPRPRS
jgi:hypothetical protein